MNFVIATSVVHTHLPVLMVIGLAIFFGTIGAKVFQRLRIPQVVGYIAIGVAVGRTGLGVIDETTIRNLLPFNFFALGIIGFMIGGELHRDVFRKYGRQFFAILFAEGIGSFIVVSLLVSGIAMLLGQTPAVSVAMGLVFGAISSATAPAATVSVLWEYKTRGVLTTAVFAIVALDDGLALVLYSLASSVARKIIGSAADSLGETLGHAGYELAGAAVLGVAAGFVLNFVLRIVRDPDKSLAFIVGVMLLVIGAAKAFGFDLILAAMALGVVLANLAPRRSRVSFHVVERFAQPIYVLFFVIAGARLHIQGMHAWMWVLVVPYVVGRSAGKIIGANIGARLSGAAPVLRKWLGACLFSQAGVAVGLSILASEHFTGDVGVAIITIIAATTFFAEIIGPPFVKFAVTKAGEVGMNVTEEDLLRTHTSADMMDRTSPTFAENTRLADIFRTIAETDAMSYPVTDADGRLTGIITLEELKRSFSAEGLMDWLVAFDIMTPIPDTVTEQTPLAEAVTRMREQELEYLPVVTEAEDRKLSGMLELRAVNRSVSREILRRQQLADGQP